MAWTLPNNKEIFVCNYQIPLNPSKTAVVNVNLMKCHCPPSKQRATKTEPNHNQKMLPTEKKPDGVDYEPADIVVEARSLPLSVGSTQDD